VTKNVRNFAPRLSSDQFGQARTTRFVRLVSLGTTWGEICMPNYCFCLVAYHTVTQNPDLDLHKAGTQLSKVGGAPSCSRDSEHVT
jgi:hypothetical protein